MVVTPLSCGVGPTVQGHYQHGIRKVAGGVWSWPPAAAIATAALVAPAAHRGDGPVTTEDGGCSVTAKRPTFSGQYNASNIPLVDYKYEVTCEAGLSIEVWSQRWEQALVSRVGEAPDDFTGVTVKTLDFTDAGTKNVGIRKPRADTGPANKGAFEDVYQRTGFLRHQRGPDLGLHGV